MCSRIAHFSRGTTAQMLRKHLKRAARGAMHLLPLDILLALSQRCSSILAGSLILRDWRLDASERPQFFKHQINLSRWRFEPGRWSFAARGVYARQSMFKG